MPQATTVQIDTDTRDRLKEIAAQNRRSMAAQIAFWVDQAERVQPGFSHPTGTANPPSMPAPTTAQGAA